MSLLQVPAKWDGEADVIVVGGGNTGLPAAITASDKGAKVMVLETSSGMASSLAMIAGGTPFAGTDFQKEQGIESARIWGRSTHQELSNGEPRRAFGIARIKKEGRNYKSPHFFKKCLGPVSGYRDCTFVNPMIDGLNQMLLRRWLGQPIIHDAKNILDFLLTRSS